MLAMRNRKFNLVNNATFRKVLELVRRYLRLEAGKVEYGTTASYIRKVKRTMAAGAAALPVQVATGGGNLPQLPDEGGDEW